MGGQVAVVEAAAVAQTKAPSIEGQARDQHPVRDLGSRLGAARIRLEDAEASGDEVFGGSDTEPVHGPGALGAAAGGEDFDAALPEGVDGGPGVQLAAKRDVHGDCARQGLRQKACAQIPARLVAFGLGKGEAPRAHGVAYLGAQTCVLRTGHAKTLKNSSCGLR